MVFAGVFVWDFLLVAANLSLCEVFLKRKACSQAYLVQHSEWTHSSLSACFQMAKI